MGQDKPRMGSGRSGIYIIKISSYAEKGFVGRIDCPNTGRAYPFASLAQMLLRLQQQMDEANFPQRWMESRATWSAPGDAGAADPAGGPYLAVFKLNVLFRQNASWQGNVVWTDREVSSNFRSVLELVELMDSALTAAGEG